MQILGSPTVFYVLRRTKCFEFFFWFVCVQTEHSRAGAKRVCVYLDKVRRAPGSGQAVSGVFGGERNIIGRVHDVRSKQHHRKSARTHIKYGEILAPEHDAPRESGYHAFDTTHASVEQNTDT